MKQYLAAFRYKKECGALSKFLLLTWLGVCLASLFIAAVLVCKKGTTSEYQGKDHTYDFYGLGSKYVGEPTVIYQKVLDHAPFLPKLTDRYLRLDVPDFFGFTPVGAVISIPAQDLELMKCWDDTAFQEFMIGKEIPLVKLFRVEDQIMKDDQGWRIPTKALVRYHNIACDRLRNGLSLDDESILPKRIPFKGLEDLKE